MKVPKHLSIEDFKNKPYFENKIPPTMENFNILLEQYNNLAKIVREMANNQYMRLER